MVGWPTWTALAASRQWRAGPPGLASRIVVGGGLTHAVGLGERHLAAEPAEEPACDVDHSMTAEINYDTALFRIDNCGTRKP